MVVLYGYKPSRQDEIVVVKGNNAKDTYNGQKVLGTFKIVVYNTAQIYKLWSRTDVSTLVG